MLNGSRTRAAPPASRRLALPPRHRRLPRPRPYRSKRHRLLRRQPLRASCSDSKTTCSESIERSRRSHARLAAVPMRRGTRNCQRSNSSSGRSRTSKGRSEHSRDRVTRRGWILFVAMALIWGIPYLFIKIATKRIQPRRVTRSRECSDLPFEVLLLPEELLLLWQLRVPRRIGTAASLACDLRDLSIDSLQVVFESLQLARSGWRRSRRWR